jgi:glycine cleavage system H protein
MSVERNLKYTTEHEWVKLEGDTAVVGITDYAQTQLGDVVFVDLPEIGKEVVKGADLAAVESVKAVSDVYTPLSGTIVEINEELVDRPELLNEDVYGQGWLVVLKFTNPAELDGLLDSDAYGKLIAGGGR